MTLQTVTKDTQVFKKIKYLCIHCTASAFGKELTADDIRRMHMGPKPAGRGWKQVGYVDMIHVNGYITNLVPYDNNEYMEPREITNGVAGKNSEMRSFSYVGGIDKNGKPMDTRSDKQKEVMAAYIFQMIAVHPDILICGHNQWAAKACPSFDTVNWLRSIRVPEKNIFKK